MGLESRVANDHRRSRHITKPLRARVQHHRETPHNAREKRLDVDDADNIADRRAAQCDREAPIVHDTYTRGALPYRLSAAERLEVHKIAP